MPHCHPTHLRRLSQVRSSRWVWEVIRQEKLQQPAVEFGWHLKIHAARDVRGLLQELGLDVGTDASVDGDADLLRAEDAVHGGNVLLPNVRASCEH